MTAQGANAAIDRLWESAGHGTRREDIVAAFEAGRAYAESQPTAYERCAKVCEGLKAPIGGEFVCTDDAEAYQRCADEIRELNADAKTAVSVLTRKQLEKLVDVLERTEDEGPLGEWWASSELCELRNLFGQELEKLKMAEAMSVEPIGKQS